MCPGSQCSAHLSHDHSLCVLKMYQACLLCFPFHLFVLESPWQLLAWATAFSSLHSYFQLWQHLLLLADLLSDTTTHLFLPPASFPQEHSVRLGPLQVTDLVLWWKVLGGKKATSRNFQNAAKSILEYPSLHGAPPLIFTSIPLSTVWHPCFLNCFSQFSSFGIGCPHALALSPHHPWRDQHRTTHQSQRKKEATEKEQGKGRGWISKREKEKGQTHSAADQKFFLACLLKPTNLLDLPV